MKMSEIHINHKISGIYKIQSISHPDKFYIGSAVDIVSRKQKHFWDLRNNKHVNKKLQNHANKYGIDDLRFIILAECDKEELIGREQIYLDKYNPFFNICITAGSSLGLTWKQSEQGRENIRKGHIGLKQSEETKRKKSEKLKGRMPAENIMIKAHEAARKWRPTEEQKVKISEAGKGNKYCLGKHWKLSEKTKIKMQIAALKNNNVARFDKKIA